MPSVCTIARLASRKAPLLPTPPKRSPNGRPRWPSASQMGRSPSVWSRPKAPSSAPSWLTPSSSFTRSTRPPPHATARPLRRAAPERSLRCAGLPRVASPPPRQTHSLAPRGSQTRQLARLLEHRRGTVDLHPPLNMLRDALKSYYPQALKLAGQDLFAPLACRSSSNGPPSRACRREKPCASSTTPPLPPRI
jgi:hypothetical protein